MSNMLEEQMILQEENMSACIELFMGSTLDELMDLTKR